MRKHIKIIKHYYQASVWLHDRFAKVASWSCYVQILTSKNRLEQDQENRSTGMFQPTIGWDHQVR